MPDWTAIAVCQLAMSQQLFNPTRTRKSKTRIPRAIITHPHGSYMFIWFLSGSLSLWHAQYVRVFLELVYIVLNRKYVMQQSFSPNKYFTSGTQPVVIKPKIKEHETINIFHSYSFFFFFFLCLRLREWECFSFSQNRLSNVSLTI